MAGKVAFVSAVADQYQVPFMQHPAPQDMGALMFEHLPPSPVLLDPDNSHLYPEPAQIPVQPS